MLQGLTNWMTGRRWATVAAAMVGATALFLDGCGGSGGGGGSTATSSVPPTVASQPQSLSVADGQPATFTVSATGTAPLAYQWFRAGQPVAGATQSAYTIATTQLSDNGASFTVNIGNPAGAVTSSVAVLTVRPVSPTIANNTPQSVSVMQGATATFNVTVAGSAPLTFQWRRNGVAVGGATTSSYTTPATVAADNGSVYDVVVTNAAGSVTSAPFTLTVTSSTQPATIASQPQAMTVRAGDSATFAVTAGGTAPFSYQWLRNGQPISGAIAASYMVTNAQLTDNNVVFSVVVTNAAGSATSAGALLMVLPQPGIAVVAGNIGGPGTIDGTGAVARFAQPNNVAIDNGGALYVADGFNVRKVSPAGAVTLFAGSPTARGSVDGPAAAATFGNLTGVTVASSGIVYLADGDAHTIRRIDVAGTVTTFAGTAGVSGSTDGTGAAALFNQVKGLAADGAGNVYVADTNEIRKITPGGVVTTIAGSTTLGSVDGTGAAAQFAGPSGVAVDGAGNLYVADTGNHAIRVVSPLGVVTTLAGNAAHPGSTDGVGVAASFDQPTGISVDGAGNIYVSDIGGAVVRKIAAGAVVTTIAGSAGVTGYVDGAGSAARFAYPFGIASDASGVVFLVDRTNFDVRRIATNGVVTRFAGLPAIVGNSDGTGSAAQFNLPFSIAIDAAANLYVGDYNNASIRKVTPAGVVSTVAGGGSGANASFNTVQGLALDPAGNIYVADRNGNVIRKVAPNGVVTLLAGTVGVAGAADGTGAAASFNAPTAIVYNVDGNLYVVDGNPTVRRVTTGGVVTTIAGAAGRTGSMDGAGNVASFSLPQGVAADKAGNLYVTDTLNSTIRKVTTAGVVSTIAGTAGQTGAIDGNGAAARFTLPFGIAIDPAGNLFLVDTTAPTITVGGGGLTQTVNARFTLRRIDVSGNVTTVAGVADGVRGVKVGALPGHFDGLDEIAIDGQGNVYGPAANGILRITLP